MLWFVSRFDHCPGYGQNGSHAGIVVPKTEEMTVVMVAHDYPGVAVSAGNLAQDVPARSSRMDQIIHPEMYLYSPPGEQGFNYCPPPWTWPVNNSLSRCGIAKRNITAKKGNM